METQAHLEISKKAVAYYAALNPSKSEQIKEWATPFIAGSGKEDEIDISLQRLLNWHFYDPESKLGRSWWGGRKSNGKRFAFLAAQLVQSAENRLPGTHELAGRTAHHIQDMSSPPHVVPVYHLADPFDAYATARIAEVALTSVQLDFVGKEDRRISLEILLELLESEARKTIRKVESKVVCDGVEIANDWTEFWRKEELTGAGCGRTPRRHFGCYGKNRFGTEAGRFTRAVYDMFYMEQIAGAVAATLRLLILLHGRPEM